MQSFLQKFHIVTVSAADGVVQLPVDAGIRGMYPLAEAIEIDSTDGWRELPEAKWNPFNEYSSLKSGVHIVVLKEPSMFSHEAEQRKFAELLTTLNQKTQELLESLGH